MEGAVCGSLHVGSVSTSSTAGVVILIKQEPLAPSRSVLG